MDSLMYVTGASLCKALGAVPALVWFLACVCTLVYLQIPPLAEGLPTKPADVVSGTQVSLLVADEQGSICEGFIAEATALNGRSHWKMRH